MGECWNKGDRSKLIVLMKKYKTNSTELLEQALMELHPRTESAIVTEDYRLKLAAAGQYYRGDNTNKVKRMNERRVALNEYGCRMLGEPVQLESGIEVVGARKGSRHRRDVKNPKALLSITGSLEFDDDWSELRLKIKNVNLSWLFEKCDEYTETHDLSPIDDSTIQRYRNGRGVGYKNGPPYWFQQFVKQL